MIPFASIFMFGKSINAMRHAWTIFWAVAVIFLIGIAINVPAEQQGSAVLHHAHVDTTASSTQSGGNMEGKETRYGLAETGVFAVGTTNTSTGAVVASHDSMTPLGGAVLLIDIFMGEITPGGVGVGMNGMLLYIILAVFIAGLMVGRTPEYLGKKVEAKQIKLALIGTVLVPIIVLV